MGQKVHPTGIRLGISLPWNANWYAEGREFADYVNSDLEVRRYIKKKLEKAAISHIQIERPSRDAVRITIHSARPGELIGRSGQGVDELKRDISKRMGIKAVINIAEIRKPELDATLVAESVAKQLEGRVMFRRAMKRAVANAQRLGAKGIKIAASGRLGGAEIAREEGYKEGRVPLHTLRADIDYGVARAYTTYGVIGVKVWIFKGEKIRKPANEPTSKTGTEE